MAAAAYSTADDVTFARESFASVIETLKPLLALHWQETGDKLPFDPDYARYGAADLAGNLRIFTVRDGGVLAGYAVIFVGSHLHHRTSVWAVSDLVWLTPRLRGRGLLRKLFVVIKRTLCHEGVDILTVTKMSRRHRGFEIRQCKHLRSV